MSYGPHGQAVPPPKRGMSTGAKIGLGCLGCGGLSVLGFVFLLVVGLLMPSGDSGDGGSAASSPEAGTGGGEEQSADEEPEEESHPGLGEVVEHGAWEITVVGIEYDVPVSELGILAEEPSGQWVTVEMEAANTGSGPNYFMADDQVLIDASGSMYTYDMMASDGIEVLAEVNPGNSVAGYLAFDVPADVEITHMMVNGESMLDEGVRVDLE
ncbi:DUF4352 domain-containing protein [Nocardiopsis sp. ARC36]